MHVFSLYVIMLDVAPPSSPNQTLDSTSLRVGDGKPKSIWVAPAPGSKMPPLETFRLTKEMVQERVKDNVIITTFGNYAFMDFILTWVKRLTDLGVENLLVGAMDIELLEALYRKGVPVFDMGSHMSEIDVGWGSPTFHKIGREKVILIDSMLPFGFELLMCDSDMVWLKVTSFHLLEIRINIVVINWISNITCSGIDRMENRHFNEYLNNKQVLNLQKGKNEELNGQSC
ncbi:putative nucleotide-diphospho-sugar transferase [Helianthus annuus]|nr:putative nucleotide-diphospho-sugar transferase [Helianthus annuus]KAJ0446074.1 putative nucleotide-diphospho-sugar transferase [Helianthus annuus]